MMDSFVQTFVLLLLVVFFCWMVWQALKNLIELSEEEYGGVVEDNCSDCPEDCNQCPAETYEEGVEVYGLYINFQCPHCNMKDYVHIDEKEHERGVTDVIEVCEGCGREVRVIMDGVRVLEVKSDGK